MKKIILNSILILCLGSCSAQTSFIETSKKIYEDRIGRTKQYEKHEKFAHTLRKQFYKNGLLDFLSIEEPLYVIEGYDLETDDTFACIKNTKGEINFEFSSKSYIILEEPIYSESLKKMIINWDVEAIKSKERNKSSGGLDIIVTKVTFNEDGSVKNLKNLSFSQFDGTLELR
ncbi:MULTISPECIES: hypothetical protein [unclassified Aquimarina]|uniref:hypothetical protein n=1 Tax=unclassified Aquimarina TaxID=2627091 RepID=UPI0018C8E756|nr:MULTISPECIES: hypothetical protein [unclassified Aquimarina]MBG6130720.1 hypothetical protein [Aquimarina sp. EL_35]MBG6151134.1 hypothetical protein [Aquimarina sp. EL_32]